MVFSTLLAAASPSTATADNCAADRGAIHQVLVDLNVDSCSAHTAQIYLAGPVRILLILLIAVLLSLLVKRLSTRLINALRLVSPLVRTTPRGADRVRTLAGVFGSMFRAVIWIVALLTILGELNINLAPFVATATVIGAAVGFGAQSLVKDFLSGVLILAEDQYGVGDHIVVGSGATATSGTVESVNLRVTRLRALDGVIWYVPNGDIRAVGNDTETDSQALVDVVVPLGTDLAAAGHAAEQAAQAMAQEGEWERVIVGSPSFAGVQAATEVGVTIRVMALTRPGQHFRVAREMRLRVLERLRQDHVAWVPTPQT
ncbi:MAG: mechanosensitive ion channel [Acidimicrobiales bacterium]|nr:mechanosensitive ion channel [Acidimicrobiales bacterium]